MVMISAPQKTVPETQHLLLQSWPAVVGRYNRYVIGVDEDSNQRLSEMDSRQTDNAHDQ